MLRHIRNSVSLMRHLGLFCLLAYCCFSGCSSQIIDNDSPPEAQFAEGERLQKKGRHLEAEERFRILKNRYPYSKFAALATLKIGDVHFEEEAYIEAAAAYRVFRELYPKHESNPYALHRIGLSYFHLMPSTDDRDLEPAESAINAFQELLKNYPQSEPIGDAQNKIRELRQRIAEKELYVGNYYHKRDSYQAAAKRFEYIIERFPEFSQLDEVLYKFAHSNERIGERQKALESIESLKSRYPKSAFLSSATELEKLILKHESSGKR